MTVQGISVGVLGAIHGAFEVSKGFTPTGGLVLPTIGAVTFIPNYLVTGVAAIAIGACIVVCATLFIQRRFGPTIFLGLSLLLFAVGGGIAHIPFFLMARGASTRINGPLTWWKKVLPRRAVQGLARSWLPIFVIGFLFLLGGIAIWLIFLPPGSTDRNLLIQDVCWSFLGVGLLLQFPTIVSCFANNIEMREARGKTSRPLRQ